MKIKSRAIIQFMVMATFAIILSCLFKHKISAAIVFTLSLIILFTGLLVPHLFVIIERAGKKVGNFVSIGITWALLVPLFYLIFFPGRIVLTLLKKDPLDRKFPSLSKSCWTEKKAKIYSKESYKRLF